MVSLLKIGSTPIVFVAGLAVLGGILAFISPTPAEQDSLSFHVLFTTSSINGILYASSIVIFLLALKSFQTRIRIAYYVLCAGLALVAAGALQFIVISYFNLWATPYLVDSWVEAPFLLGLFLLYVAPWLIARQLGVKNFWTRLPLIAGIILASSLLSMLIPHSSDPMLEKSLDILVAFNIWEGGLALAGIMVLLSLKRTMSLLYTPALAWLILLYGCIAFGDLQIVIVNLIAGYDNWFVKYNAAMATYLVGALCGVKAAIEFRRNTYTDQLPVGIVDKASHSFFGVQEVATEDKKVFCGEVINTIASLASNPRDIDSVLDKFRAVTAARRTSDQTLSDADQSALAAVYLEIETYLVTREPARKFSREELRFIILDKYRTRVDAPTFWQQIESNPAIR
jgi:hypothetical protein